MENIGKISFVLISLKIDSIPCFNKLHSLFLADMSGTTVLAQPVLKCAVLIYSTAGNDIKWYYTLNTQEVNLYYILVLLILGSDVDSPCLVSIIAKTFKLWNDCFILKYNMQMTTVKNLINNHRVKSL